MISDDVIQILIVALLSVAAMCCVLWAREGSDRDPLE